MGSRRGQPPTGLQLRAKDSRLAFHQTNKKRGATRLPFPLRPSKDLQKDLLSWSCTVRGRLPKPS